MALPSYSRTQQAPLSLIFFGSAIWLFVLAWIAGDQPTQTLVLVVGGILMTLIGLAFHHLNVEDEGDRLAIRFGPRRLFRTSIRYTDIQKVEVGRTLLLDGWGIHWSLRGGWLWNLWGRDCVGIHRRKGKLRIGTDDAAGLPRFLEDRMAQVQ
jgi:hypothetical protein